MATRRIGIGAVGLGRAFMLMLPTFAAHPRVRLVAASDPRPEARAQFTREFGGAAHATIDALCSDPAVEAIYIACDARAWLDPLPPPVVPRGEVLDEFCDAIDGVRPPIHTGRWAMATLEACLAILESSRTGHEVELSHQVALDDAALRTQFRESAFGGLQS